MRTRPSLFVVSILSVFVASPCFAGVVAFNSPEGDTFMSAKQAADNAESAVHAVLVGPTEEEIALGIWSAIPQKTRALSIDVFENGVLINLSAEAAEGLDDATWETMQRQFLWTMRPFGLEERVKVLIDGREVTELLSPTGPTLYSAPTDEERASGRSVELGDVGLSGKRITLCPGHGHYWNGSGWYFERPFICGYEQEDMRNMRVSKYLRVHLENDGAYVQPTREFDMTRGTGPSGVPWWQESAYIYLKDQNYSCANVWANATGRCTDITGAGVTRLNDTIRAKPLASNNDDRGNTDILIDIHSNAYQGECYGTSCPTGTDGMYTDDGGHEPWAAQSISLAQKTQDGQIAAVQAAGFSYGHHGSTAALYGNFASTRMAQRPAALLEIGFHDSCTTDAPKINDPFFQDCGAWGIYNGVCQYFGNTPTYGLYDSEYISDTIPGAMVAGEVRTVQITFKNKSVRWDEAHAFRLGAVGDSDPFSATRHTIVGIIENNDTYTFSVQFAAPTTPGTYTTDWRMVRDMFAWFGQTLTKEVTVSGSGATATPTSTPTQTPLPDPRFYNALQNGGFENDFTNWVAGGSGATSYEILTSGAHSGIKACRFYRSTGAYATIYQNPNEVSEQTWRTSCWAYYIPGMTATEFGFKDQGGNTEASVPINTITWGFYSVDWLIADNIDSQAWGTGTQGVVIDDVRAGPASKMNWITDWIWNGTHDSGSKSTRLTTDYFAADGGEASILPAPGSVNGGRMWTATSRGDGFINLNETIGGSPTNCAAYAHIYVIADTAKSGVRLLAGSDDGVRVFLNGALIHNNDIDRSHDYFNPDTDAISGLSLNAGQNRLLVKVRQETGGFSLSARFCDINGNALSGLTYSLSPILVPTNTPTFTATWTPTHTPTWTSTQTHTPTITPSWTPSWTPTRTPSWTPTNTAIPTPTPVVTHNTAVENWMMLR